MSWWTDWRDDPELDAVGAIRAAMALPAETPVPDWLLAEAELYRSLEPLPEPKQESYLTLFSGCLAVALICWAALIVWTVLFTGGSPMG
jgi:hypothetical protein